MEERSFNAPYRAKTEEEGKESVWIYGFYVRLHDGKGNVSHRIYPGNAESDCGDFYPDWFEIDPDTLCRYSELPDKNGTKIFEGDILKAIAGNHVGEPIVAKVVPNLNDYELMWDIEHSYELEIIGNIHDNPELLEEG